MKIKGISHYSVFDNFRDVRVVLELSKEQKEKYNLEEDMIDGCVVAHVIIDFIGDADMTVDTEIYDGCGSYNLNVIDDNEEMEIIEYINKNFIGKECQYDNET